MDNYILKDNDDLGRNLLYIVAWNDFNDICVFLMEEGIIEPNKTQKTKNTPFHGDAYYGQISKVDLLRNYSAKTRVKNNGGNTPIEETYSGKIKDYILK